MSVILPRICNFFDTRKLGNWHNAWVTFLCVSWRQLCAATGTRESDHFLSPTETRMCDPGGLLQATVVVTGHWWVEFQYLNPTSILPILIDPCFNQSTTPQPIACNLRSRQQYRCQITLFGYDILTTAVRKFSCCHASLAQGVNRIWPRPFWIQLIKTTGSLLWEQWNKWPCHRLISCAT